MLTGLPPAATGVRLNSAGRIPPRTARPYPLLAERLREEGWRTVAAVAATPLHSRYGLDQGFDTYDDEGLDDATGPSYARRPGAAVVDRALAHAATVPGDERLFLWVHLFDPHAPYPGGSYAEGVAQADVAFGRLLRGLESLGRGDAVVLLTSDHGEALGEHGEPSHGFLLGDAVLRVPLLLSAPDLPRGSRSGPADVADVAPTLAALAGLHWPDDRLPGGGKDLRLPLPSGRLRVAESLFAYHRYRWAQAAGAVGADGRMLVETGAERVRLFQPSDPGEPQATPAPTSGTAAPAELRRMIADYKGIERRELITGGDSPGGYGHGGRAVPFLPVEENGRLLDPYGRMAAATVLGQLAAAVEVEPRVQVRRLVGMSKEDAENPELRWLLGRALELSGDLPGAKEAYGEAWRLGQRDARTLVRWAGVDAGGNEPEALAHLRKHLGEVSEDVQVRLLEGRLLCALGQTEDARAAFRAAAGAARSERERAIAARALENSPCR
jgi:hypothetical protein